MSLPDIWVRDSPFGNPTTRDLHREWFSPRTNFYDGVLPQVPITHFHNWDDKGNPVDEPIIIGVSTETRSANPETGAKDGRWHRVRFADKLPSAIERDLQLAIEEKTLFASPTAVGDIHKVADTGEITHWLTASIAVLRANGRKRPASFNAIGVPALKSMYLKAGIEFPDLELPKDTPMKFPDWLNQFHNLLKAAPELTTQEQAEWDEVFGEPARSKPNPTETSAIELVVPTKGDPTAMAMDKTQEEALRLEYDNKLKASAAETAELRRRFDAQEIGIWFDEQLRAGKVKPAERELITGLALQAKADDAMPSLMKAAGDVPIARLAAFKASIEGRTASTVLPNQIKAGGFDAEPTKDERKTEQARLEELLATTPEGRKALAEMGTAK